MNRAVRQLEQVDTDLTQLELRIAEKLKPYAESHGRLVQIPGVDRTLAAMMIAELGTDMSVFLDSVKGRYGEY